MSHVFRKRACDFSMPNMEVIDKRNKRKGKRVKRKRIERKIDERNRIERC